MFTYFDRIHQRDKQPDRHTARRHTPRLCIASRAKKLREACIFNFSSVVVYIFLFYCCVFLVVVLPSGVIKNDSIPVYYVERLSITTAICWREHQTDGWRFRDVSHTSRVIGCNIVDVMACRRLPNWCPLSGPRHQVFDGWRRCWCDLICASITRSSRCNCREIDSIDKNNDLVVQFLHGGVHASPVYSSDTCTDVPLRKKLGIWLFTIHKVYHSLRFIK